MPRFRKKLIVIEAEQFIPGQTDGIAGIEFDHATMPFVRTLEGPLRISPYDWIITGVKGEKYPCKPDIFAATYEPVEN